MDLMNRWFTRYLLGVENGIEEEPRAWITRAGDDRLEPTPYPNYPNPQASDVTMYLTSGAPQQGRLSMERTNSVGTETVIDNFSFSGDMLAQAEWTDHRLMYITPTLAESMHISGIPEITVSVASSKPAVNLSVWLVSLPWNSSSEAAITDNIITRGWADPQNHESISESEPLEPGQFYTFSFELQPDDQLIPAGQQIGLMIFSSDRDFTLRPDPGTELTLDLERTSLTLPVVGGTDGIIFGE